MQIGAHVSSAGGIDKAIDRAVAIGADSVQVFTQSPRAWRPTNHDPASFERVREKRAEAGGAGGTIGRSVEELATIYSRLGGHPRLGVCLDSCHLWVSGVDVTDPVALDSCLDELDSAIGLDRLRALHVNDAAAPLGSNRDRHANILEGELGEELGAFLAHASFQQLPVYLEVPGKDKKGPDAAELTKLRELLARWANV